MTTPRGPIVFNNGVTGSDTAASGLGPATAVTGTAAAHTGGVASTTITLTNSPDLSGLTAGDMLFLATSSTTRRFSVISAWDNTAKTVTVDDSFTIASGSAVNYAIGGKRQTLDHADSRRLGTDLKGYVTIEIEYTGTNYTLTSTQWIVSASTGGNSVAVVRIKGTGGRPVIEQQANIACFSGHISGFGRLTLENLWLINTAGTKTLAFGMGWGDGTTLTAINCVFGSLTTGSRLWSAYMRTSGSEQPLITLIDCAIINAAGPAACGYNVNHYLQMSGCFIRGGASYGIAHGDPAQSLYVQDSIITGCANHGIAVWGAYETVIRRCTIHGCGGSGIVLNVANSPANGPTWGLIIESCNITDNSGYGVLAKTDQDKVKGLVDYNNFGHAASGTANSSGPYSNITMGDHDLTVDPQYADADNFDFSVGPNVTNKGYLAALTAIGADQSNTIHYQDIGAARHSEPTPDEIAEGAWVDYLNRTLTS